MKKIIALILVAMTFTAVFTVFTEAALGDAAQVISRDVELIKTGLIGQNIHLRTATLRRRFALPNSASLPSTLFRNPQREC